MKLLCIFLLTIFAPGEMWESQSDVKFPNKPSLSTNRMLEALRSMSSLKVTEKLLLNNKDTKKFHKVCRPGYHLTTSGRCRQHLQQPIKNQYSEAIGDGGIPDVSSHQKQCERGFARLGTGKCRQLNQTAPTEADYN